MENVINSDAFENEKAKKEEDAKSLDKAKQMDSMQKDIANKNAERIIKLINEKKSIDVSDLKDDIANIINTALMMGLLVPLMLQ